MIGSSIRSRTELFSNDKTSRMCRFEVSFLAVTDDDGCYETLSCLRADRLSVIRLDDTPSSRAVTRILCWGYLTLPFILRRVENAVPLESYGSLPFKTSNWSQRCLRSLGNSNETLLVSAGSLFSSCRFDQGVFDAGQPIAIPSRLANWLTTENQSPKAHLQ